MERAQVNEHPMPKKKNSKNANQCIRRPHSMVVIVQVNPGAVMMA